MQITITVDENMLQKAAETAIRGAYYQSESRWDDKGAGARAIHAQVKAWAEAQDYRPYIEKMAPAIFNDVVRDALSAAIRKAALDEIKRMKAAGEFGALFAEDQS